MTDKTDDELTPPLNPTHFGADEPAPAAETAKDAPEGEADEGQMFIFAGYDEAGQPVVNFGAMALEDIEVLMAAMKLEFIRYRNEIAALMLAEAAGDGGMERKLDA